jgi:putative transposase
MARHARVVVPGIPYHVTHRGNHRRDVFLEPLDRELYLADLAVWAHDCGLRVWGYCLMTNHVHLLAVPDRPDALARAVGRVHQRHARRVHARHGWTGHLWANRFFSTPLDTPHLWAAIRYVELNPVRAGLVGRAEQWPWSSAGVHAAGEPGSPLLDPTRPFGASRPDPRSGRPMDWTDWLALGEDGEATDRLRRATLTGRPCGDEAFVERLESALGRELKPKKRGRPPKVTKEDTSGQGGLFGENV